MDLDSALHQLHGNCLDVHTHHCVTIPLVIRDPYDDFDDESEEFTAQTMLTNRGICLRGIFALAILAFSRAVLNDTFFFKYSRWSSKS